MHTMEGADKNVASSASKGSNSGTSGESNLLDQLQDLHRRLAEVRQSSQRYNASARNTGPVPMAHETNKIIVCSVRRCLRMVKTQDDDAWQYILSETGFRSAIDYLAKRNTVEWITWPGAVVDESSQDGVRRKLESEFNCHPVFLSNDILDLFYNQFCNETLWPLFHSLSQRSDNRLLENFHEKYEAYCLANQKFLEVVSEVYKDGDLVLVADYQLMHLPALLRRRFPEITCAFYLHCPFPSSEFFQMLSARESLLQGVLGADLVVFNHFDYVRHFLNACTRMLGLESSPSRVEYNGRLVSLGICPMGIDPPKYAITPSIKDQVARLEKQKQKNMKILVGVHTLDFCKGILEMLEAMDYLLQHYPEYRGEVQLFAIVRDYGRTASCQYKILSRQVDELVGKVNGKFGTAEYCPIRYFKRAIPLEQLIALYNVADVAIVSSIKEGINLQAMEFVASQKDTGHGVLVYSEFAGCASSFQGALLVNPMHIEQVAASIDTALKMNPTTKRIRHEQLSRYVNTYTSTLWSQRIMSALNQAAAMAKDYNRLEKLDTAQLLGYYERSQRRLFLLDHDGTLNDYKSMSELAEPSAAVLACLEELSADPRNSVYIISGRTKYWLEKWYGHLARVGLAAEHGFWFRPAARFSPVPASDRMQRPVINNIPDPIDEADNSPDSPLDGATPTSFNISEARHLAPSSDPARPSSTMSVASVATTAGGTVAQDSSDEEDRSSTRSFAPFNHKEEFSVPEAQPWQCMFSDVELEWRHDVEMILEHFTERTPGSLLDIKDCSCTWHFRDADSAFGLKQAKNMQLHFDQMLRDRPVAVVMCRIKKYVTIRPWRVNKGRAVSRILEYECESPYFSPSSFDFILSVGDERTDEDMFNVVQGSNSYTVTVGHKVSRAQYYVEDPDEVLRVLTACNALSTTDRQTM